MKKVIVIGSGFAGLSAAACLAQKGFDVTVLEKNDSLGGRARQWITEGFTFDMGPSWYWMPNVFEEYFALFGKKVSDYYDLHRLDPGYRVCFGEDDFVDIPASMEELENLFESYEEGSSLKLRDFLAQAKYKYEVGMGEYVFRPSHSITEFIDLRLMKESLRIQMLTSISKHVRKYFKNEKLIKLLEFPVLFLGATPQDTPAMYSMMNYADLSLGTWYPMGGMNKIIEGMVKVAEEQGVKFETETEVQKIVTKDGKASSVLTSKGEFHGDWIVAGNDYHNTDQKLLNKSDQNYTEKYWDDRTMSPSSLLFYLGIDKRLDNLEHHNLFFDEDFNQHAEEIYKNPRWPSKPLFYACCPSQTDDEVAPEGKENLFLLIPIAPDLPDNETTREKYYNLIMDRLENLTGQKIREHVILKRSYALDDFKSDYNSFKGNAYGLANTLSQTAFFKPRMKSKKVSNLFFTGQLTVPGPGVPPSIISGRVVADEVAKEAKKIFEKV